MSRKPAVTHAVLAGNRVFFGLAKAVEQGRRKRAEVPHLAGHPVIASGRPYFAQLCRTNSSWIGRSTGHVPSHSWCRVTPESLSNLTLNSSWKSSGLREQSGRLPRRWDTSQVWDSATQCVPARP